MIEEENKPLTEEEKAEFSEEAKAAAAQARKREDAEKKAVIRMIEAQWARATKWKETVKPDAKTKLDKYSVAKLNGFGKCKDIISFCVNESGRETFEVMMSDDVTVEVFCRTYGFEVL